MGCLESCMKSGEEGKNGGPTERTPLFQNHSATPGQPIPAPSVTGSGNHLTKTDEESALNRVLQKTANDVIDVTYIEPHSIETAEVHGRTREYHAQVASMRGVSRQHNKLPSSNQPPQDMLSKELVSPTDLRFISDRSEAMSTAVESMEIKSGEPLVVQFAAP